MGEVERGGWERREMMREVEEDDERGGGRGGWDSWRGAEGGCRRTSDKDRVICFEMGDPEDKTSRETKAGSLNN